MNEDTRPWLGYAAKKTDEGKIKADFKSPYGKLYVSEKSITLYKNNKIARFFHPDQTDEWEQKRIADEKEMEEFKQWKKENRNEKSSGSAIPIE